MLRIKIMTFNPIGTNCILAWQDGSSTCAVVDPGCRMNKEKEMLVAELEKDGLTPEAILLTHGHFDHFWGVTFLVRKYGIPVYMDPADKPMVESGGSLLGAGTAFKVDKDFSTTDICDGDVIRAGGVDWKVISTPGHTPGGVCFYSGDSHVLLSGDTLFAGTIGRTDLPGGDYDALMDSILKKVMVLPGDTDVVPGHGPATTIAREAMSNPMLQPFNEPIPDWNRDGIGLDGNL